MTVSLRLASLAQEDSTNRDGEGRQRPLVAHQPVKRTTVVALGQVLDAHEFTDERMVGADGQGGRELFAGEGTAGRRHRLDPRRPGDVAAGVFLVPADRVRVPINWPGVQPDSEGEGLA